MDNLQPEISPPETPAGNSPTPAILWKGDHSMQDVRSGRSHLQVGPIGGPGGNKDRDEGVPAPVRKL